MGRARRSAFSLVLVLVMVALASATSVAPARRAETVDAAAVTWPVSTLLLSEIATGGASASDEFVELVNAGPTTVDLAGLEVVYATATGTTVTRKASWTAPLDLAPGQHLLIANVVGAYGALADATYSGGLAASGGAVALRIVGGPIVDAIGWGDASNGFVEGTPALAPPARSSLERRPGGVAGNGIDSNDDATDWFIQGSPSPQDLAAVPTPSPSPATPPPTPDPTDMPSMSVQPTPSSSDPSTPQPSSTPSTPGPTSTPASSTQPTPGATATPSMSAPPTTPSPSDTASSPADSATPADSPTPAGSGSPSSSPASPSASATPESAAPSPSPTATPSASPSPSEATPIAVARALPDSDPVTVEGVLTTDLGALEAGRSGFVQDATGGIAIYLDAAVIGGPTAGTLVRVTGTLDERYGQRTLRASIGSLVLLGSGALPGPLAAETGAIGEALEGTRLVVSGVVTETPSALADGTGLTVDDGSGPVRVVVTPAALALTAVTRDTAVIVIGPLGQRDSTGTGLAGYRVLATGAGEFSVVVGQPSGTPGVGPTETPEASSAPPTAPPTGEPSPPPSGSPAPTPTTSADGSPTASAGPSGTLPPSSSPTTSPSPSDLPVALVDARAMPIGSTVRVRGVVTAEAGRLGSASLIAIADATAGIVIRLPAGVVGAPRGTVLLVTGILAAPYGQLEIRPGTGALTDVGPGGLPAPLPIVSTELGESVEGGLIGLDVVVDRAAHRETNGTVTLDALDPVTGGRVAIRADASSGIATSDLPPNRRAHLVGIAGQRATRTGRLDGYRVWLRDRGDIALADPTPSGSPSPGGSPSPSTDPTGGVTISIRQALLSQGAAVRVEGTVTAAGRLFDSVGRVVVIQDATAAVAVRLPATVVAPRVGDRLRVEGTIGRAYGAPRIAATGATDLGSGAPVLPIVVRSAPGPAHEWRLVRVDEIVADVHRLGDRWRAEIAIGSIRVLVTGVPGAAVPSTALVEGRRAIVIGVVRRPYPTATDRRFAVVPRSSADIRLGAIARAGDPGGPGGTSSASGPASIGGGPTATGDGGGGSSSPLDIDLATLGEHLGQVVRVGGIVTGLVPGAILVDDGTAIGRIALGGDASAYLGLLAPGDVLDATGLVRRTGDASEVAVTNAADVVRIGDPGGQPSDAAASAATDSFAAISAPTDTIESEPASTAASVSVLPVLGGCAGFAGLVALAFGLRRRRIDRARRVTSARIAARLAVFAGSGTGPAGPP